MFNQNNKESDSMAAPESLPHQIVNYYESIIRFMPGNVYWIDKNGVTMGCNKNVLEMFGFEHVNEFRGLSFSDMAKIANWSKEAEKKFEEDTMSVVRSGMPVINSEEPPIKHTDGHWQYFLTSRVPIFDNEHNVLGVVGISIDVTDKREVEQLKIEKDLAEEQTQIVELFAGSIAHELRTPLSSIKMGINGLEQSIKKLFSSATVSDVADTSGANRPAISKHKTSVIKGLCQRIQKQAEYALFYIDMSLANIRHQGKII